MLFSEPIFFLFFSGYFALHLLLPRTLMLSLLILGSSIFYGYWNPRYLPLPFALVLFTHLSVQAMSKANAVQSKKWILWASVTALLIPLFFFKYTNFFLGQKIVTVALPLGISFITFTLIAYVVDVYRGKFAVEKSAVYLLSSVLFFPHLIAGPIVRPSQLIPQLKRWNPALTGRFVLGLLIFSVGLFKKLVIADPLGSTVNQVYLNLPSTESAWLHLLAFYGFTIQIYCDFSGYTDMALGISRILGIRLPTNFNRPYVATSLVDFWTRWHITLSSWLRDYLYIPLGGNRKGKAMQIRNIFITMGLGGLWHGASWTFVFWGFFHAVGISSNHLLNAIKLPFSFPRWAKLFFTFQFVSVGWVLFRAKSLEESWMLLSGLFTKPWIWSNVYSWPIVLCFFFAATHFLDRHRNFRFLSARLPRLYTLLLVLFLVLLAAVLSNGNSAEFIYFDF